MGLECLGKKGAERRRKGVGEMEEGRDKFVTTNSRHSDATMQGCEWKLLKLCAEVEEGRPAAWFTSWQLYLQFPEATL